MVGEVSDSDGFFDRNIEASALRRLGLAEFESLRHAFERFDPGRKGLGREGFRSLVRSIVDEGREGPCDGDKEWEEMMMMMFDLFDTDRGGTVSFREFICGYSILSRSSQEDVLRLMFHMFDENGNGELCIEELRKVIRQLLILEAWVMGRERGMDDRTMEELAQMAMQKGDIDGNQSLCFDEFLQWVEEEEIVFHALHELAGKLGTSMEELRERKELDLIEMEMARMGLIANDLRSKESKRFSKARDGEVSNSGREKKPQTSSGSNTGYLSRSRLGQGSQDHAEHLRPFIIDFDSLVLNSKIGTGAFAEVFEGEWLHLPVAIKVLNEFGPTSTSKAAQRDVLLQEVGVLTKLRHPNIVLYMGVCIDLDQPLCVIVELFEGGNLLDFIQSSGYGALSRHKKAHIALAVARGMLYLHSSNPEILHRDLKSQNVLVSGDGGRVTICDFGLSKLGANESSIHSGEPVGTASTMAPEIIEGSSYTRSADVYSFGIILWEIFYGKRVFGGMNAIQIMFHVTQGHRPPMAANDGVDPEEKILIQRCLSEDPSDRPDFVEIARILSALNRALNQST